MNKPNLYLGGNMIKDIVVVRFAEIPGIKIVMTDKEMDKFVDFTSDINQVRNLSFNKIARWIRSNVQKSYEFMNWYDSTTTKYWVYPKGKFKIADIADADTYTRVLISGLLKPLSSTIDYLKTPQECCVEYCRNDILTTYELSNVQKVFSAVNIKNVIFNNPATIVFWSDGTKTVCVCSKEDTYDPEKGLALCVMKKTLYDNKGYIFNNAREKWLKKAKKTEE